MHIYAKAFQLQKGGNKPAEYEDAFWPSHLDEDGTTFRFAVADGATETSFAGVWAKLLVRAYAKGTLELPTSSDALAVLSERWRSVVGRKPLPWYAEEKVRLGASATFLGLTLESPAETPGTIRWRATAFGDSCVFQVRGDNLLSGLPVERSADFNNEPPLLSSGPANNRRLAEHLIVREGEARPEDAFYLMTDALACWFWASYEKGEWPWQLLRDLDTSDQACPFPAFIESLRKSKLIRNDDVTVLRLEIG